MNVRIMTIRTWDFRNRLWLRFHTTGCFSTKSNSMSNPSLLVQEVAAAARRLWRSWRVWCGPACGWCLMGPGGWWTVESRRGESDQIAAELTTADGRTDIFIELITGREITGVTGVLGTSWSWSGGCWHICSIRHMQLAATNKERKCEDKE